MAAAAAWLPTALQVGGTLLSMSGQRKQAEAAEANAERSRAAGEMEADIALRGAETEVTLSRGTAALNAANARRVAARRQAAAALEAQAFEAQAGQAIAASQRDVFDVQRLGRLAQSRAIALAAASGGGVATAPTVIKIVGGIAGETAYNAGRALYAGEEKARQLRMQAIAKQLEGEIAFAEGEEEALNQGFSGEVGAILARFRGAAKAQTSRMRGEAGFEAGMATAAGARTAQIGTLLSGAKSIYDKYGGGGPGGTTTAALAFAGGNMPFFGGFT